MSALGRVTIVGLGLMGGSLALAFKRAGVATEILGCGRQVLLERALEMKAIDGGSTSLLEAVRDAGLVVLCTPVETSIRLLEEMAPVLKPGALVTDVGSTKLAFAEAARRIFGSDAASRVLPGHPLAGREVSGLEHAAADLYQNAVWALTPLDTHTRTDAQRKLELALASIGARIVHVTPAAHDRTLAYTSHLPQMLSTALAMTLRDAFESADDPALQVHAGGLRSMLRLAFSDPVMWQQVAGSNRENIAAALEACEKELRRLRECLGREEFRREFASAREFAGFLKKDR
ncbi:MAG: prephenate dehydrogenase [Acidobacteriota bacterium]|nr:prephenate dehydrogenase [Acidobacteriota bacterium]